MIRIIYERMDDFRRAVKDLKIRRIFYNVEVALVSKEQNAYAASLRLTVISPDASTHLTLLERIVDMPIPSEQEKAEFDQAITNYKNKFFDLCRETMPEILTIPGLIVP